MPHNLSSVLDRPERLVVEAELSGALVNAVLSPERALDTNIERLQLGEMSSAIVSIRQEMRDDVPDIFHQLGAPRIEFGRGIYATPTGEIAMTRVIPGDESAFDVPLGEDAFLLRDPTQVIPESERIEAIIPHTHPSSGPTSIPDIIHLFRNREQSDAQVGTMVLRGDEIDAIFRGPNTPEWDAAECDRRLALWRGQLKERAVAQKFPGMTLEEWKQIVANEHYKFFAQLIPAFDLQPFHGPAGSDTLYKQSPEDLLQMIA